MFNICILKVRLECKILSNVPMIFTFKEKLKFQNVLIRSITYPYNFDCCKMFLKPPCAVRFQINV